MTMPDHIQPKQPRREFKNYRGNFLNIHLTSRTRLLRLPSVWSTIIHFGGKRFANDEEFEMEVQKWLRQQSKDFSVAGFDALVKRWNKCINVDGVMLRNKCFLQVLISHVLRFIAICDLFTDSLS
jgi:hypothetical protein